MTPMALEGIRVLDFSHLLQGPFATQLMADMGADVIKIERPGKGDLFRSLTFRNKWVGGDQSPNFLAWNRNKRCTVWGLRLCRTISSNRNLHRAVWLLCTLPRPKPRARTIWFGQSEKPATRRCTRFATGWPLRPNQKTPCRVEQCQIPV